MGYQVIDNFLSDREFDIVKNVIFDMKFPWGYCSSVNTEVSTGPDDFQFVHVMYQNHTILSEYFQKIQPLINKLNPNALVRVKVNLTTKNVNNFKFGYHTDFEGIENLKSAVYYLDTTDGPTFFENGEKVECVANRLLIFDNNMPHTSSTCTDEKVRRVININFF